LNRGSINVGSDRVVDRQNHTLGGFLQWTAPVASPSIWRDTPPGLAVQRIQTRSKVKCGLALPICCC
jgi:hypothetical protein